MRARGDWSDEELRDIDSALDEVAEVKKLSEPNSDIWGDACRLISLESSCDIGNSLLYDTYGKNARLTGGIVSLKDFVAGAREVFGCETLSSLVLDDAYNIVCDLWHENEATGDNGPDGSFQPKDLP